MSTLYDLVVQGLWDTAGVEDELIIEDDQEDDLQDEDENSGLVYYSKPSDHRIYTVCPTKHDNPMTTF